MAVVPLPGQDQIVSPYEAPSSRAGQQPALKVKVWAMVAIVLVFLAGISLVAQAVRVNTMGYRLTESRQNNASLERENQRLEFEVAARKDPARIAELAQTRLGMVQPDAAHVVRVSPAAVASAESAVRGDQEPVLAEAGPETGFWPSLTRVFSGWLEADNQSEMAPVAKR